MPGAEPSGAAVCSRQRSTSRGSCRSRVHQVMLSRGHRFRRNRSTAILARAPSRSARRPQMRLAYGAVHENGAWRGSAKGERRTLASVAPGSAIRMRHRRVSQASVPPGDPSFDPQCERPYLLTRPLESQQSSRCLEQLLGQLGGTGFGKCVLGAASKALAKKFRCNGLRRKQPRIAPDWTLSESHRYGSSVSAILVALTSTTDGCGRYHHALLRDDFRARLPTSSVGVVFKSPPPTCRGRTILLLS